LGEGGGSGTLALLVFDDGRFHIDLGRNVSMRIGGRRVRRTFQYQLQFERGPLSLLEVRRFPPPICQISSLSELTTNARLSHTA
jgi:hypothetical protein